MPAFQASLGTEDGRIIKKEMVASDISSLRERLESEGFYIFSLKRSWWSLFSFDGLVKKRGIGPSSLIAFTQELLALLKSGLPVVTSLDSLIEKTSHRGFKGVLNSVREEIAGGASLSESLCRFPSFFPDIFSSSLKAGEKTGELIPALTRNIDYLKKTENIRKALMSASVYPLILLIVTAFALFFLIAYVVPSFTQIYLEAGALLPAPTRVLLGIAAVLSRYKVHVLLIGIFVWIGSKHLLATEKGRNSFDATILMLPFFGELAHHYSLSTFMRSLSSLVRGGISIVDALKMASLTCGNITLKNRALSATKMVIEGKNLTRAMGEARLLTGISLSMLSAGEAGGALPDMLDNIADLYEDQVNTQLKFLSSAIEPVLMVIMGVIVAAIVISMYLPIFNLAGTIR